MSKTVLIFEDDLKAIGEITFLMGKHAPNWKIVGIGSTATKCYNLLETVESDIIITDIHFGNEIVFNVLPQLSSYNGHLVFASADNNFAAQAFQLSASNYLLKPINEIIFQQMVAKIESEKNIKNEKRHETLVKNMDTPNNLPKKIAFETRNGYLIKNLNEIIYAKADNNYTEIYFKNKEKLVVSKTMLFYEKMLKDFDFVRIHQSYLVNFEHVVKFDKENFVLKLNQGDELPVSSRKKTVILELMHTIF